MSDDLIQQLREELAKYQDLNRQLCDKSNRSTIMIARLEEQLAEAQKQIVMLREAIVGLWGSPYWKPDNAPMSVILPLQKALNATQDLSGLVLCDAEPVGTFMGCIEEGKAFQATHPDSYPLYQTRKAK